MGSVTNALFNSPLMDSTGRRWKRTYICRGSQTLQGGFIGIDCGATKDYLDDVSGIFYRSNTGFIDRKMLTSAYWTISNISPKNYYPYPDGGRQTRNLRSFPQGKKNCYTLKPEQGKNSKENVNEY
ncbi:hypothetical protein SO802_005047, partial [Lithocarpus litseifolius]